MTKTSLKPVIGITEPSQFINDCVHTIEEFFDANPIKLSQNRDDDLYSWLGHCDGVILAGGCDIHPRLYRVAVTNHCNFSNFDTLRDVREIKIINYCFSNDIPILGICRGHQMLGIYHNFKMIVDLVDTVVCHNPRMEKIACGKAEPMHWVQLTKDADESFVNKQKHIHVREKQKDARYLWVNSFHHQGLLHELDEEGNPKIHEGVEVLGVAPARKKERIVELMRGTAHRWLSCQWHPEFDWRENPHSKMVLKKFRHLLEGESLPQSNNS